jgi:hypothetical protein
MQLVRIVGRKRQAFDHHHYAGCISVSCFSALFPPHKIRQKAAVELIVMQHPSNSKGLNFKAAQKLKEIH